MNLNYIRISIDYYDEEKFSEFRGIPNILNRLKNNIILLRKNNVKVGVGITLMDDSLGANFFRAVPIMPIGKAKGLDCDSEFYSKSLAEFMKVAQNFQSEYYSTIFLPDDLTCLSSEIILECPGGDKTIAIDSTRYTKRCPISNIKTSKY